MLADYQWQFDDDTTPVVSFNKKELYWLLVLDDCLFFDHSGVQEATPFELIYKEGETNCEEVLSFSKKVQKAFDFGRNNWDFNEDVSLINATNALQSEEN